MILLPHEDGIFARINIRVLVGNIVTLIYFFIVFILLLTWGYGIAFIERVPSMLYAFVVFGLPILLFQFFYYLVTSHLFMRRKVGQLLREAKREHC